MGSWNHTCAVSNLHVHAGQEVVVFMLAENQRKKTFCYNNALYDLCPIPFYGKYNDYGAVEDCEGFGMTVVVEAIREQLYEFGQGPNEYHDCEVRKESFNIEVLFEADHEDRLFIQDYPSGWNQDEYDLRGLKKKIEEGTQLTESQQFELDRLANAITRKYDPRRAITHVVIHKGVFDHIMKHWYIEDYVGEGKGTTGYGKSYNHVYFADLAASVPEAVRRMKEKHQELKQLEEEAKAEGKPVPFAVLRGLMGTRTVFEWDDPCLAGSWLNSALSTGGSVDYAIVPIRETLDTLTQAGDWHSVEKFLNELMVGLWVNSFMSHTRKLWTKQTGAGSQNSDHLGYKVLSEGILEVLKAERAEYGMDEDEEEDLDETEADGSQTVS